MYSSYLLGHFGLASLPEMRSKSLEYGSSRLRIDYEFRLDFQCRKLDPLETTMPDAAPKLTMRILSFLRCE
ncbi:MAG: hypothetical protein OXI81_07345 [Paracoccaceae bacterium]|nr:hypothetical protein [Paracoccaceae bacterium]